MNELLGGSSLLQEYLLIVTCLLNNTDEHLYSVPGEPQRSAPPFWNSLDWSCPLTQRYLLNEQAYCRNLTLVDTVDVREGKGNLMLDDPSKPRTDRNLMAKAVRHDHQAIPFDSSYQQTGSVHCRLTPELSRPAKRVRLE
ncbi:hypothetical protein WBN46_06795 [Pseudoxanthomonas sp. CCNWLW251]